MGGSCRINQKIKKYTISCDKKNLRVKIQFIKSCCRWENYTKIHLIGYASFKTFP